MNTTTCLASLLLVPAITFAQQVSEQTTYYNVSGATAQAIRASINQSRPADDRGQRHDALTKWNLRFSYKTMPRQGGCAVSAMDVTLTLQVILPRWVNESAGSPDLVNSWRRYQVAIVTHENGHKQVALNGANRLRNEALSARGPNCNVLGPQLDAMTASIVNQIRGQQNLYDQQTDHGSSQGARFP
jgi:predicted secreted Zn-dependent protease